MAVWLTLPALYVLSIGPASYLAATGGISPAAAEITRPVYRPVAWWGESGWPLSAILETYVVWWTELAE